MTTRDSYGKYSCNAEPLWLHQRSLGKNERQRMKWSHDFIEGLKIEARLVSKHDLWVELDWNRQGDLLANSQFGSNVVVWDVFKRQVKCRLETGHANSRIKSLKFMPALNDTQVVTCGGNAELRLTNLSTNQSSCVHPDIGFIPNSQLAVHPDEPHLIWSAGNGHVVQCDIRQPHGNYDRCCPVEIGDEDGGHCIVVNPLHSEMLAVGSDHHVRLFDRRAPRLDAPQSCIAQFGPTNADDSEICEELTDISDLAFNHDGSELLVCNYFGKLALFNTYEPWEKFRSFDPSNFKSSPLIFDQVRNDRVREETRINRKLYKSSRLYDGPQGPPMTAYANFFGGHDEFVVFSNISGFVNIWDKSTTDIVKAIQADTYCTKPHPNICMLASICTNVIKLWSTIGRSVVRDEKEGEEDEGEDEDD